MLLFGPRIFDRVVALDYSFHIRHTAVANFRGVPVEWDGWPCVKCLSINLMFGPRWFAHSSYMGSWTILFFR